MFSKAVAEAKEYTRSVVGLYKRTSGKVETSVSTFIHLDDVGHILTSKHVFNWGSEDPLDAHRFIFDRQYFDGEMISEDVPNDLILIKLKGFKPGSIKVFPRFLRSTEREISKGTPLVRFGFPGSKPFANVSATWNDATGGFHLDTIVTKDFHNSGLATGYEEREGNARLLETDFPALPGQSGGPVLNAQGVVVGLTSRNTVWEDMGNLETGLATSHLAIARLLRI
jgi:S1-C subfamily serine protease